MTAKQFVKKNSSIIATFVIAFLLLIIVSIVKVGYSSPANLKVLSISIGVLGLTALGQTFPILIGGMDLSIPWVFCIGGYLCAALTNGDNTKLIYAVPIVLIVGLLMGAFNGIGIAYVGIAPVIMTMASNIIFQGLLVGITEGTPGGSIPKAIKSLASGGVGFIGTLFLFWLLVSLAAWFTLSKSPYGRRAALAGMLYAGKLSQLYLGMGDTYQMASVSAVAIGGVSLIGGSGSYIGTMAGCFVIVILEGFLAAMNFSQGVQKIVYGVVLLFAVLISSKRKISR